MSLRLVKGRPGIGDQVEGIALVASDNFSARYDLDRINVVFSRRSHALYGQSYVGRILVLNAAKGGVATAWMLREMQARQLGPSALLLNFANPILAQGAAFAGLPLIDRFEADITSVLKSGDRVRVSPRTGEVLVLERDAAQP